MQKNHVTGLAASVPHAEHVISCLQMAGFSNNDISVLFPDTPQHFPRGRETKAPVAAAAGAGGGGMIGGTLGWLAGLGALVIPGAGPFIAAGPIMGALSGVAVGAGVGSLAGGLIGLGIPEPDAKHYEGRLREGNILISAHTKDPDEVTQAKKIFEQADAHDICINGEPAVPADIPVPLL
jgi:hypothetical protein